MDEQREASAFGIFGEVGSAIYGNYLPIKMFENRVMRSMAYSNYDLFTEAAKTGIMYNDNEFFSGFLGGKVGSMLKGADKVSGGFGKYQFNFVDPKGPVAGGAGGEIINKGYGISKKYSGVRKTMARKAFGLNSDNFTHDGVGSAVKSVFNGSDLTSSRELLWGAMEEGFVVKDKKAVDSLKRNLGLDADFMKNADVFDLNDYLSRAYNSAKRTGKSVAGKSKASKIIGRKAAKDAAKAEVKAMKASLSEAFVKNADNIVKNSSNVAGDLAEFTAKKVLGGTAEKAWGNSFFRLIAGKLLSGPKDLALGMGIPLLFSAGDVVGSINSGKLIEKTVRDLAPSNRANGMAINAIQSNAYKSYENDNEINYILKAGSVSNKYLESFDRDIDDNTSFKVATAELGWLK